MNKLCLTLLLACSVCFGQAPSVNTRVSEGAVSMLTLELNALDASAHTLTNSYVSLAAAESYASNAVEDYVSRFLPGLLSVYTFPFTTNSVTFADDTTQTFGRLNVNRLEVNQMFIPGELSLTGTGVVDAAYLLNTHSVSNITATTLTSTWRLNVNTLVATRFESTGATLTSPLVRTDALTTPSGESGAITAGTNALMFTGDVYIRSDSVPQDKFRFPVLVCDPVSSNNWYNPAYVFPSGTDISSTYPLEFRAAPISPAEGYWRLASGTTNRAPLFGTGPRAASMRPGVTGVTSVIPEAGAGPYVLSVFLLPALPAGLPLRLAGPLASWVIPDDPVFPDLPERVLPWVPPTTPAAVIPSVDPSSGGGGYYPPPQKSWWYTPSVSTSIQGAPLTTTNTWKSLIDSYYVDTGHPDTDWNAAWQGAMGYAQAIVSSYVGNGAAPVSPFAELDYEVKIYRPDVIIAGPRNMVIARRYSKDRTAVETTYERQMYVCWRVFANNPSTVDKYTQQFVVRSTKSAWLGSTLDWNNIAYAGRKSAVQFNVGGISSVNMQVSELPSNLFKRVSAKLAPRAVGDVAQFFYVSGDTAYGFADYGSTYRIVFDPDTVNNDYVSVCCISNGTSLYNPGVPEYLARQFIYEDLGGGIRGPRELDLLYKAGEWYLWRERSALFIQKAGTPDLLFLRHYDDNATPALDISVSAHPFVVDSLGSPGESGYGNPVIETMMTTSLAEELTAVTTSRNATNDNVTYTIYAKKWRPK